MYIVIQHIEGVPVAPLALRPERGGPKNLPITKAYLGDLEEENKDVKNKPHLVIVGGGWGVRCSSLCATVS